LSTIAARLSDSTELAEVHREGGSPGLRPARVAEVNFPDKFD
jgi:hypothetical protein